MTASAVSSRLGKTCVVINEKAGAALGHDGDLLRDYVQDQLGAAATSLRVASVRPSAIVEELRRAVSDDADTIIVAGGDGSVCAAANAAMGGRAVIGVIPLGTANLMARDLGMPLDFRAAIDALIDAEPVAIDVAEVNGRVFLCSSLLGLPSSLPRARQRLRGGSLLTRIRGYAAMARSILRRTKSFKVRIDDGSGSRPVRMQLAVISNNPYDDSQLVSLVRPSLSTGKLGLYVMKHETFLGAAWLLLKAFLGSRPRDPQLERREVETVTIEAITRKHFELSNDGELERFASPLVFRIRPAAIRMLRPRRA
ncbi:MAG: diacylglycerol kinase family protein [Hyphomicrobiales bacterium]|nr:diacylglycerol kinase family protein [Hyphomicrobiales bacterium]